MASLVTVGDVCGQILGTVDIETTISDAAGFWQDACLDLVPSDPLAYLSLVSRGDRVVGYLDFSDLIANSERLDTVGSCMTSVSVETLLTAETPILEAMKLFDAQSPYCFLVMRGNVIVGAFSYQDLLSIPFRSCLFAMLLSIEQAILDIAQTAPALAVSKLRDRGKRVEGQIRKKLPDGQTVRPTAILERSSFAEVLNALKSCSKSADCLTSLGAFYTKPSRVYRLKAGATAFEVKQEKMFRTDQAVELRNALAHPKEPWRISQLLPKEDLKAFISWLTELEVQLAEYLAHGNKLDD